MKVGPLAIKAFIGFGLIVGTVACGESGAVGPTSPSALQSDSAAQSSTPGWSTRDESRVPPIRIPAGISCPSDAPIVIASTTGLRVDIEWSWIPMVSGYEVAIERLGVLNAWEIVHVGSTGRTRYEWRGTGDSRYRVRVRSIRCGGTGMWSGYVYVTVDGPKDPDTVSPEEPSDEPDCEYTDYSTRGSSQTQTLMPCDDEEEEPGCEYSDYSMRGWPHSQISMSCDDGEEEEEPGCEESSEAASARGSARTQTFMPCGWSWDRARVRR